MKQTKAITSDRRPVVYLRETSHGSSSEGQSWIAGLIDKNSTTQYVVGGYNLYITCFLLALRHRYAIPHA